MGRRKIEIKAIKDDRNRSVTFLKRKGGLFKKAHELSVLCSVDVAVIIFGHNKKLYEFASGDINETIGRYQYYGGAHEHKGPEDFMGKKDMDDDDEDDDGGRSPPPGHSNSPPEHGHMMPQHLQHQPQFAHIRTASPSHSPPMPNGVPFQHRGVSPQPPPGISRPNSRAHVRRGSSLAPPSHHSQPPPSQNGYAYVPNPPFYNPQAQQGLPPRPPMPPHPPQYQYTHPPAQHQQVQYIQQQEQRRQSMPPTFTQAPESKPPAPQAQMQPSHPHPPPPQQQQQQQQEQSHNHHTPPQPQQGHFQSPPMPQPKPLPVPKKHSVFTPIDDSSSVLAAHWGRSEPAPRSDVTSHRNETNRSHSIDTAAVSRQPPPPPPPPSHSKQQQNGASPRPSSSQLPHHPQRTPSVSSVPTIAAPSRANSMTNDPRRPRLKVQIPSEQSDTGSATADSSPKDTGTTGETPLKPNTGVVLPPPSPSASAILSAGASGPPNPFARPPPPGTFGGRDNMETPISALPSRFVENNLLPSPSSFYPEWGFGRDSNMLPSPLTFQTPVGQNGPSFRDDDDRKRKTSDPDDVSQAKRIKA